MFRHAPLHVVCGLACAFGELFGGAER
jgi:hypothetical protein